MDDDIEEGFDAGEWNNIPPDAAPAAMIGLFVKQLNAKLADEYRNQVTRIAELEKINNELSGDSYHSMPTGHGHDSAEVRTHIGELMDDTPRADERAETYLRRVIDDGITSRADCDAKDARIAELEAALSQVDNQREVFFRQKQEAEAQLAAKAIDLKAANAADIWFGKAKNMEAQLAEARARIDALESAQIDYEFQLAEAKSALSAMEAQRSGHDARCYYCNEPCNSLAGNPGLWPIPLCHEDEPGVVKYHHIGCVSERLARIASLEKSVTMRGMR